LNEILLRTKGIWLVKAETYKEWEEALSYFRNAEELLKDEKFDEAAKQARTATMFGIGAIMKLSKELEMPDLSTTAYNAFLEGCERERRGHYTPKENIKWYRGVFKRFTAELPPDTFRPFR